MIEHFRRKYSFSESLNRLFAKIIAKCLHSIANVHLAKKRPQLAVFAYDHISHFINIDGYYERDELDLFFSWISKYHPSVFNGASIDIGANIGNHSIVFSSFFQHVYSFEPNPRTYKLLKLNSELVENMTCFPFGISDHDGSALLSTNQANVGSARVSENQNKDSIQIRLKKLDSLTGEINNKITLMKFDIEGHEYQAISGSAKTIEQHRPLILFEQQPSDFENGSSRVIEKLKSLGYQRFLTISSFPNLGFRSRSMAHKFIAIIYDLIFGERIKIQEQTNFSPGFYSFIVAVPNMD